MGKRERKVVLRNTNLSSLRLAKAWEERGCVVLWQDPDNPKAKPIPFMEAFKKHHNI
jgi:hypothetical protein